MNLNVILGFISIVVTLMCAYLGALLHRKTERIKIMEGQLSEKRYFMISSMKCLKIRKMTGMLTTKICVISFLMQRKN